MLRTNACRCYLNQFMWQLCNLYTLLPFCVCKNLSVFIFHFFTQTYTHARERVKNYRKKKCSRFRCVRSVYCARVYLMLTIVRVWILLLKKKKNRKETFEIENGRLCATNVPFSLFFRIPELNKREKVL